VRRKAAAVTTTPGPPTTPAYIFGRFLDVLAANPLAGALAPWFTAGENLVKGAFLDPRRRDLRPDWVRSLGGMVAALRANVGPDIDDPRLTELVGELSLRSEQFRQLWARHDARPKSSGTTVMHHPQGGRLELSFRGRLGRAPFVAHAIAPTVLELAIRSWRCDGATRRLRGSAPSPTRERADSLAEDECNRPRDPRYRSLEAGLVAALRPYASSCVRTPPVWTSTSTRRLFKEEIRRLILPSRGPLPAVGPYVVERRFESLQESVAVEFRFDDRHSLGLLKCCRAQEARPLSAPASCDRCWSSKVSPTPGET